MSFCALFFAFFIAKENTFRFLKKPIFLSQSVSAGLGSVLMSFAYGLAPASIMLAANRSSSILWAIISGNHYFHEKHILIRLFLLAVLVAGLVLLAV
jgi:multidrug transporter EmrE-like cation transporter